MTENFVPIASGQAAKLHAIQKTCLDHGIEYCLHESDATINLIAKIPTLTTREGSQSHDTKYVKTDKADKAMESIQKKPKCSATKPYYCFSNGFKKKTKMLIPDLITLPGDVSDID